MKSVLLRVALLATVSLTTVAGPVPTASAAPEITITPAIRAAFPIQVPTADSGDTVAVAVVVSSPVPVVGATVRADGGDGLVVADGFQQLGDLAQPETVTFHVAGAEPGRHELFIDVTTAGTAYGYLDLRSVWTTGSPLFQGTNGLYARSYTWQGTEQVAGLESPTRAVRVLSIVSPTFAYVGLPAYGEPTCTQEGGGCVPYAYDAQTQVLQVGTGIIAGIHRNSLYTDGWVPADREAGEAYGRFDVPAQSSFTGRRWILEGTYRYASTDYPAGLTYEKATFRRDRTYSLAWAKDGGRVHHATGRFRLGHHGKITFRSHGRVVQRGTVLLPDRPLPCVVKTTCRPGQRGIFLVLSGPRANHPDGNLLQRAR